MIKRIFLLDHNQVLEDIRDSFQLVDNWYEAEAVVVWQDLREDYIELVANANLVGIPTVVMQHGLRASREYNSYYPKPLLAKKIMVWGPKDKERIMTSGILPNRIEITGTTLFDHLVPREKHKGANVVFVPIHWDKEVDENYEIAKILNSIQGLNLKTKLIEGLDASHYKNVIRSNRDSRDHLGIIANLLKDTDLLVSLTESTFEFLAYKLDIPVIVVDEWKPKMFLGELYEKLEYSEAAIKAKYVNLKNTIFDVLQNPSIKSTERTKVLYEEAGVGFSKINSKNRIVDVIKNLDQDIF